MLPTSALPPLQQRHRGARRRCNAGQLHASSCHQRPPISPGSRATASCSAHRMKARSTTPYTFSNTGSRCFLMAVGGGLWPLRIWGVEGGCGGVERESGGSGQKQSRQLEVRAVDGTRTHMQVPAPVPVPPVPPISKPHTRSPAQHLAKLLNEDGLLQHRPRLLDVLLQPGAVEGVVVAAEAGAARVRGAVVEGWNVAAGPARGSVAGAAPAHPRPACAAAGCVHFPPEQTRLQGLLV